MIRRNFLQGFLALTLAQNIPLFALKEDRIKEGTFTPSLSDADYETGMIYPNSSYNNSYGHYKIIGDTVYLTGTVEMDSRATFGLP